MITSRRKKSADKPGGVRTSPRQSPGKRPPDGGTGEFPDGPEDRPQLGDRGHRTLARQAGKERRLCRLAREIPQEIKKPLSTNNGAQGPCLTLYSPARPPRSPPPCLRACRFRRSLRWSVPARPV